MRQGTMDLSVALNRAGKARKMIEFFDSGEAAAYDWPPEVIESARARFAVSLADAEQVIAHHADGVQR